jgi:hypothetical protein
MVLQRVSEDFELVILSVPLYRVHVPTYAI